MKTKHVPSVPLAPSFATTHALIHSSPWNPLPPDLTVPISTWKAAGEDGVELLMEVNDFLAPDYSMPIKFSDQLLLVATKGEEAEDAHEACRAPGDTRPLSLKKQ